MKTTLLKLLLAATWVTPALVASGQILLPTGPADALFVALDSDYGGTLDQTEWNQLYPKVVRREKGFTATDLNGDGVVTLAEFKTPSGHKNAGRMLKSRILRTAVFLDVDTNGDGLINREEVGLMWSPGASEENIDAIWTRISGGKDMSLLEWVKAPILPGAHDGGQIHCRWLDHTGSPEGDASTPM